MKFGTLKEKGPRASLGITVLVLAGCLGPIYSKWDDLRQAEADNASDIQAHCYTQYTTNELLCEQAKERKRELADTRAEWVRQAELEAERERQECEARKDRAEREYDRQLRTYEREMDRYEQCRDRQAAYGYTTLCILPTTPYRSRVWC